jgi:uncharacterized membrane protein
MYPEQGSIDQALSGSVDFTISEILSDAWERTKGVKLTFLGAFFVTIVILSIVEVVFGMIFNLQGYRDAGMQLQAMLAELGVNMLSLPIETPLMAALMMMAIKHANGYEIRVGNVFDYYVTVWPLVFAALLMYLMIFAGLMLLIIPGIYLSVAYAFVYQLIIDKNMGVWEAMETSRKAVSKRWFPVFGLMLANALILIISALPLGIGLFWTLPMAALSMGILYTRLFGYEGDAGEARLDAISEEDSERL